MKQIVRRVIDRRGKVKVLDLPEPHVTVGGIAIQALRRAEVQAGETVAIYGLGLVGQPCARIAARDRQPDRALAKLTRPRRRAAPGLPAGSSIARGIALRVAFPESRHS